tara:strand:- start:496 stop:1035 length:540 start_codon:yes stop_codon:yes gene_type:complete
MAITIKVGPAAKPASVTLELNIRKSIEGDLMIFDHGDIDIVLSPGKKKIIAFPKENINDLVYGAQNRLFAYLHQRGIVIPESVQAGAFYGAIEANLQEGKEDPTIGPKMALINISEFIDEERPYFEAVEAIVAMDDEQLIHPDKEDSTELGEVPQKVEQGSIYPGFIRDPYSLSYLYTL